jgi:hypothetical protein
MVDCSGNRDIHTSSINNAGRHKAHARGIQKRGRNSIPLINVVIALDPNLVFRISAAGMDDGPCATLTRPTVTNIDEFRLTRGDDAKRTAMRIPHHRTRPLSTNQ